MSLKSGVEQPRSPLRLLLDRELSAGPKPLRASFVAQHRAERVLMPLPGVGTEAGTSGTAIDTRLRLAFSTAMPVDLATLIGIEQTGCNYQDPGLRMRAVGYELANRSTALDRAHDEEEDLARLLIAAAWFQIAARTLIGFEYTPLLRAAITDPGAFTLERLLELPHRDLVADVVAQLHHAAHSPLSALRAHTRPEDCTPGPTFPDAGITADGDLVADGLLLDFKSTRHPHHLSKNTAWQLLGYLLLDVPDRYRIDAVGLYLTRSGILATWPVEDFLALLGTCHRDLTTLRALLAELLNGCVADREPITEHDRQQVQRLLQRLWPVADPGCCPVCTQPVPPSACRPRTYCSPWCARRAPTLRRKGQLAGDTATLWTGPRPRATMKVWPSIARTPWLAGSDR